MVSPDYLFSGWRPYAILLAVGCLLFSPIIWYQYAYLDEDVLIIKNFDQIKNLSNIIRAFETPYAIQEYYRPFVTISLIFDAQFSQLSPWMYHATNILIHLFTTGLVYALLLNLKFRNNIAFFSALIFLLHPMSTQTIAWIPGRNDSIVAMFVFISMIFFIKAIEINKIYFFVFHLIAFFCALLSKETAVLLPFVSLLYIKLFYKSDKILKKYSNYLASWLILIVIWLVIRSNVLSHVQKNMEGQSPRSLLHNLPVLFELISKLFMPFHLSPYPHVSAWLVALGIVVVMALIIIVYKSRFLNTSPQILFLLLWAVAFLIPGLYVKISHSEIRFDYLESRAYLSVFGIASFIGLQFETDKIYNRIIVVLPVLYVIFTLQYSPVFKNGMRHWDYIIAQSPMSADAYSNRAIVSTAEQFDSDGAIIYLKKAISLFDASPVYHDNLGLVYESKNQIQDAENEFKKAINLDSLNPRYHCDLGIALAQEKRLDLASNEFVCSVQIDPNFALGYGNLGYLCYLVGDYESAENNWLKAISLDPNYTGAMIKLAYFYYEKNRYQESQRLADRLKQYGIYINLKF